MSVTGNPDLLCMPSSNFVDERDGCGAFSFLAGTV
jgi:hypothetical protein